MMSLTDLSLPFWGYALETVAFTLNRVPSKSVETTPYELWFVKRPNLSFLKIWGCDAYVKKLQPNKLESKSDKCVFVGYPKETIGYSFYNKTEGKVFVAKTGVFLEKEVLAKGLGSSATFSITWQIIIRSKLCLRSKVTDVSDDSSSTERCYGGA